MHLRIRRRREERGIPAYVLAKSLGISPAYISLIESGKKVPSEDIARRIAAALADDV
jgi:transcriptional regulator with XRE-family HTH domain